MTDHPASGEPTSPLLSDADKLRLIAAWFDMWDSTRYEDRQRILDDENNPGKNDVQRDLRRIAAIVEAEARATPPALDARIVERIFEGEIGNRLYFFGAAYGHPRDESYGKIADDFAAAYARLTEGDDR